MGRIASGLFSLDFIRSDALISQSQPGFGGCETVESDSPMYIAPRQRGGVNAHLRVSIFVFGRVTGGYHGSMPSYPSLAQTLTDSLHLERPPVAVCFADAVPSGVKQFTGSVPAGCRFWQEAQSGVFATVPARPRSVRHRDLHAQSGSLARGAKGSGRCAQSIRRPGLCSRTGYSADSGSEKSSAGGDLRPAESGSPAARMWCCCS